jgi:hypothetical protein
MLLQNSPINLLSYSWQTFIKGADQTGRPADFNRLCGSTAKSTFDFF